MFRVKSGLHYGVYKWLLHFIFVVVLVKMAIENVLFRKK